MYETFFKFTEKPFSLLPNANFLYLSKRHKSALDMLRYGIHNKALITVITGEVGCGKTTLLRKLLNEVSAEVTVGLITNTHCAFGDVLKWVLLSFNLDFEDKSKIEQYETLLEFVINEYARNRRAVLIVDEAQNLTHSALEELRMLSNINVDEHQVLQLVLVGQPELRRTLQRPGLKQFAQRISAEYHISPLEPEETGAYIRHRLRTAGGDPGVFLAETYPLIYGQTRGVPRLINILCDMALVHAYGTRQTTVNLKFIKEVIKDLEGSTCFENRGFSSVDEPTMRDTAADEVGRDAVPGPGADHGLADESPLELAFTRKQKLASRPQAPSEQGALPESEIIKDLRLRQQSVPDTPADDDAREDVNTFAEIPEPEAHEEPVVPMPTGIYTEDVRENQPTAPDWAPPAAVSDRRTPWITAVASVLAIVVSIAVLYIYQKPPVQLTALLGMEPESERVRLLSASVSEAELARAEIEGWLTEAGQYLEREQYVLPSGGNAYEVLQKVLERDPGNAEAQKGMEAIRDNLYAQALAAEGEGDWVRARGRLTALLGMEPESERVRLLSASVSEAELARAEIEGWLTEAGQYLEREQYVLPSGGNAYEVLQKVLERDPGNAEAQKGMEAIRDNLYAQALAAEGEGDWVRARGRLTALLGMEPESERVRLLSASVSEAELARAEIEGWLTEAGQYLEREQYVLPSGGNAYEVLQKVLERDPGNAEAQKGMEAIRDNLYAQALAAEGEGDWVRARGRLTALLGMEPESERVRLLSASVSEAELARAEIEGWLTEAGQYLEREQYVLPSGGNAYEVLQKVLERDPGNAEAQKGMEAIRDNLYAQALAAEGEGDWVRARGRLTALLGMEPESERVRLLSASVSEAELARAEIEGWLTEAGQYLEREQYVLPSGGNAYEVLQKVLERDPGNAEAQKGMEAIRDNLYAQALAAEGEGDWVRARGRLTALLGMEPESERVRLLSASVSEAELARAEIEGWLTEAGQYLEREQYVLPSGGNAYEVLQKVLERDPGNAEAQKGMEAIRDNLYAQALAAEGEGDWVRARGRLTALLGMEPESERVRLLSASVSEAELARAEIEGWLTEAGQYLEREQYVLPSGGNAYEVLQKVLERDPGNAEAQKGMEAIRDNLYAQALAAEGEGDWVRARGRLTALLGMEPESERVRLLSASVSEAELARAEIEGWLTEAGQYLEREQYVLPSGGNAYEVLQKVLERDPGNAEAQKGMEAIRDNLYAQALAAEGEGDWVRARGRLTALLGMEPESERVRLLSASVSEAELARAEIEGWLTEAGQYLEREQYVLPSGGNAYEVLQKVLERDPGNAEAQKGMEAIRDNLYAQALAAEGEGDWVRARGRLTALLGMEPESERVRLLSASVSEAELARAEIEGWLTEAGQYLEREQYVLPSGGNAYEVLQKVLERDPGNAEAQKGMEAIRDNLYAQALAAEGEGDWVRARGRLTALLGMEPESERVRLLSASVSEAELARAEIEGWLTEAGQYLEREQYVLPSGGNAYEVLQKVLERDPGNAEAQKGMEAIRDNLYAQALAAEGEGDWVRARGRLTALLGMEPESERVRLLSASVSEAELARAEIEGWLTEAGQYLEREQYVLPSGGNAYEVLQKVLERDPGNAEAQKGMEAIRDNLYAQALAAEGEGDWVRARGRLTALLGMEPESERVRLLSASVSEAELARAETTDTDTRETKENLIDPDIVNIFKGVSEESHGLGPANGAPQTARPEEVLEGLANTRVADQKASETDAAATRNILLDQDIMNIFNQSDATPESQTSE